MAGGIPASREPNVVGLTDEQIRAVSGQVDPQLIRVGYEVIARQKTESFRQAWKNHWKAACWSIFLTSALFMEGFDTAVVSLSKACRARADVQINSFFGLPGFLNSFGIRKDGKLAIPANYQSGLTNIAYCGQIIGLFINGWCQERFGARKSFIGGMILMTATIFLAVFAVSLNMLLVAELAMGIPWGMFREPALATSLMSRNSVDGLRRRDLPNPIAWLPQRICLCWLWGRQLYFVWGPEGYEHLARSTGLEDSLHTPMGMACTSRHGMLLCARE